MIGRRLAVLALALWGRSARAATHEVSIKDMQFHPAELRIRPGDSVRWVNHEKRTSHSVRLAELESERLLPGDAWAWHFNARGRHPYVCGPHPDMRGVVIVED